MRFLDWPWLFLLLLIPILHRYWKSRALPPRVAFSIPVPKAVTATDPTRWLWVLRYAGMIFLVLALARPQSSSTHSERTVSGVDVMLVMDVSASMNIEDLDDRSRFDVAKETMEGFVRSRSNDRIGFVMFSGEPYTAIPVTLDHNLVLDAIQNAKSGVLKDGTAIGDGLSIGVSRLRDSKAKSRLIVLLTDGDNNVGQVDPLTAGELAAGYKIRVYTIAIGTEGRVKLPIRSPGPFGQEIVTYQWMDNALNPELLKQISEKTNARFYRVTDAGTLSSVFKEIDQLEKSEIKVQERVRYDDVFPIPLQLGVVLLLAEQLLARFWWRVLA